LLLFAYFFVQFRDLSFQLIFLRTKLELLFELVVLLVVLFSLLLLSGELLLESTDVVLLGEELVLEGSNFFAGVLMLWLFCLFVLNFMFSFMLNFSSMMFGVFLNLVFNWSRFVRFGNWFSSNSFSSSCDGVLFFCFHGLMFRCFGLGWLRLSISSWFVLLGLGWWLRLTSILCK